MERGNRGQGVKGVRLVQPTALVVGDPIKRGFQAFETASDAK